jgi:hypothetical protein
VYLLLVTRQRLGINVTPARTTRTKRRIVGCFIYMPSMFYERKAGDWFFPEILVFLSGPNIHEFHICVGYSSINLPPSCMWKITVHDFPNLKIENKAEHSVYI